MQTEVFSRFMAKVKIPADPDQCWNWQAAKNFDGYGNFRVGGKSIGAHRISFEIFNGAPSIKHVLHSCDNPACVNPAHLREGTHADNMRDVVIRKRHVRLKKTHCIHGHEYSEESTRVRNRSGYVIRECRTCDRGKKRARS